jgi:hypothetical protein
VEVVIIVLARRDRPRAHELGETLADGSLTNRDDERRASAAFAPITAAVDLATGGLYVPLSNGPERCFPRPLGAIGCCRAGCFAARIRMLDGGHGGAARDAAGEGDNDDDHLPL